MTQTVDIDEAIRKALDEYSGEVVSTLQEVIPEVLKEAKRKLKSSSPARTGNYAKGWKVHTEKSRVGASGYVANDTDYQLTHLLENGHAKRGGGRVAPIPHIGPVNDWATEEIVKRIEEELGE